jgi:hypothetical protein
MIETEITATLVAEEDRLNFLPRHLGRWMMRFEGLVYQWMRRLSHNYTGGCWKFLELSNGSFYMAPSTEAKFLVTSPNAFQEEVTADAAGIVATMFALNTLIGIVYEQGLNADDLIDSYHQLRNYASNHAEAGNIFAIID